MSKLYFQSTTNPIKDLGNGVFRELLSYGGSLMIAKVSFETDSIGVLHQHSHEQTTYVLSGKFIFTIGKEQFHCSEGDSIYIHSEVLHGCKCLEKGCLLDIFTPMRDDFLV